MATEGKCDVCGCDVARGGEPVTASGWYSGHYYYWSDTGRHAGTRYPKLGTVRCPAHHPANQTANAVDEFGEPYIRETPLPA